MPPAPTDFGLTLTIQVGDKVSADVAEIGFLVREVTRLSIEAKNALCLFGYLSRALGVKGGSRGPFSSIPPTVFALQLRT
jgi:hypothetical protein